MTGVQTCALPISINFIKEGAVIPTPGDDQMRHGNVGISFALRTPLLLRFPFIKEVDAHGINEDWIMMKNLMESGCKIHVSPRIAYFVRPTCIAE